MSAAKPPKAVDTHVHVFSAQAPAVPGARYRPAYGGELGTWRAQSGPLGITHGVVVQPSFFGADNREMLDTISSAPGHLRGVAVVPANIDGATLRRFHAAGVRAARLNLRGVRDYSQYASPAWRAAFDLLKDVGWHVECFVDTGRVPELARVLEPTAVSLVFDHFGAPGREANTIDATFAAVRKLARDREVWVKFSGPYRLEGGDAAEHAKSWLDAVGPARVVWGSDWPCTGFEDECDYEELFACLHQWVDAALVPAVLWDNPARLYGFA